MLDRIQNMNWGMIGVIIGTITIWYFLIMYPITTISIILGLIMTTGLLFAYAERKYPNE